jgi:hypothetical protein
MQLMMFSLGNFSLIILPILLTNPIHFSIVGLFAEKYLAMPLAHSTQMLKVQFSKELQNISHLLLPKQQAEQLL